MRVRDSASASASESEKQRQGPRQTERQRERGRVCVSAVLRDVFKTKTVRFVILKFD